MEQDRSPFSESYWQMHRNTLVLSSLLCLTCSPGIEISETGNFFGLEPTALTLSSLRFILCLVATYSFIAFANEWVHEALPYFKKLSGLHATAHQRVDDLATTITEKLSEAFQHIESAQEHVSNLAASALTASDGANPTNDLKTRLLALNMVDEVIQKQPDKSVKAYDVFYPPPRGTESEEDMLLFRERMKGINKILSDTKRETVIDTIDRFSGEAVALLATSSQTAVDDMRADLRFAVAELQSVTALFSENRHYVTALRARLFVSQKTTTFRIWIIGILAPSLAFAIAWALYLATLGVPVLTRLPHG